MSLTYTGIIKKHLHQAIFFLNLILNISAVSGQCIEGDCLDGQGKIRYESGGIYEGTFHLGKPNGKGIFKGPKYTYSGEYVDGKFNGIGIFENDKLRYEGFFTNNKFEGGGKLHFFDGESYSGNFSNNLKNGMGKYIFQDSTYYEGEWFEDKINGKGTMYIKGKYRLQGKWSEGELEGTGFAYYDSGDIYEGAFTKSVPEGYGILYLKNGGKMVGTWKNGEFESGLENKNTITYSKAANIVTMKENDGIFEIPAIVNNASVDFILNTGSSMTLISKELCLNMIKNNLITESDIVNSKGFYTEKGELNELIQVKIKSLQIGNAIIQNTIVGICPKSIENTYPTIREPHILGQNILREIGKFQIDYSTKALIILQK